MSRIKRFAHSLASGYALLALNVGFTLAQVPLALHYLTKSEFGLWALTTQITGYLLLLDLGMSGALVRHLMDGKDQRQTGAYGATLQTGMAVQVAQGAIIALGGGIITLFLPWLFPQVETELLATFRWLVLGQCGLFGLFFVGRTPALILQAHQRFDIFNYSQMAGLGVNFGVQWLMFQLGGKLYSLLYASAATFIVTIGINSLAARHLHLWPRPGEWGRLTWSKFWEVFRFGNELFLLMLGLQLMNASQVVIIARTMGLPAAATWTIATRTFLLMFQALGRIYDFSAGALGEMMVRGEQANLKRRYRDVMALTATVGALGCVGVALCNSSFLTVWTSWSGKPPIAWDRMNDVLMGGLVWLTILTRCNINLAILAKDIRYMRWIYFLEGACFVGAALLVAPHFGFSGVILTAVGMEVAWIGIYGFRWASRYFGIPPREPLAWLRPGLLLLLSLAGVALGLAYATGTLRPLWQLILGGSGVIVLGGWLAWMFGLAPELRQEIQARARRLAARFGAKPE